MPARKTAATPPDDEGKPAKVDDYPERPYSEAVTDEQRALLKEYGQEP